MTNGQLAISNGQLSMSENGRLLFKYWYHEGENREKDWIPGQARNDKT